MAVRAIEGGKDKITIFDEVSTLVFGNLEDGIETVSAKAAGGQCRVIGKQGCEGCRVARLAAAFCQCSSKRCFDLARDAPVRGHHACRQNAHEKAVVGLAGGEQGIPGVRLDGDGNQAACVILHRALVEIGRQRRAGAHALAVNKACLAQRSHGRFCVFGAGAQHFQHIGGGCAGRHLPDPAGGRGRRQVLPEVQHRLRRVGAREFGWRLRAHEDEKRQHAKQHEGTHGPLQGTIRPE